MKILFLTFGEGHLVSDKEYATMAKGFAKLGMELIRYKESLPIDTPYDILMVKGWSYDWDQVTKINVGKKPVVYLSIGTEWKVGSDLNELNKKIEGLYLNSDLTVHISEYCKQSHWAIYSGQKVAHKIHEQVIILAREPNLPDSYEATPDNRLRLAVTCIPRPVKRIEELERLCKKHDIDLVPAYGSVTDFSYYRTCHGWISLSRKEGMCNAGLEAIAWGLPLIMTNYGGNTELVGDCGIVIKNDPENCPWDPSNIEPIDDILFEKSIKEFLDNLNQLRYNVRERVRTELNDFVAASRFKRLFELLI
jgi:glycosyltransferase involved in cell wall biosynthesis